MKRYAYMLFLALLAFGLGSCKQDEEIKTIDFELTDSEGAAPSEIRIGAASSTFDLTVRSNAIWAISIADKWLTSDRVYGEGEGQATFTAEANTEKEFRNTTITFYANNIKMTEIAVSQEPDGTFIVLDPTEADVPVEGGDVTINVDTNAQAWEYRILDEGSAWLHESEKAAGYVTFTADENMREADRSATVEFTVTDGSERITAQAVVTQKYGSGYNLMLDVVFNNDGTAYDASPSKRTIETIPGSALYTYKIDSYGLNAARFNNSEPGNNITTGYYKADYANDTAFQNGLADGHSLEVLFMYDGGVVDKEIKMFSSMEQGGTGFLLGKNDKGNSIIFLPHTGSWNWANSNVVPQKGVYYHVIGIFDPQNQKASIYVDGEKKAEVATSSNTFKFPTSLCYWFGIGVDASNNSGQACWKGDVVIARVYDDVLTGDDVTKLWNAVKDKKPSAPSFSITDPMFLTDIEVGAGSKYKIIAQGFNQGDQVRFESLTDENSAYTLQASRVNEYFIEVEIPANFKSDKYRMTVLRDGAAAPVGFVTLTMSDSPVELVLPKVIAHRGYHTTNGAGENTVESFQAALDEGFYGSEADFYITSDGYIVSNHDASYNGITIETAKYSQVSSLPTLDDYLDMLKASSSPTKLVLEFKSTSEAITTKAVEAIKAAGMESKVDYIAFNYDVCKRMSAAGISGATVGYLNGDKAPASLDEGISIDYTMSVLKANPAWIDQAHEQGRTVNVWTVNTAQDMLYFISQGVDYISTDYPADLNLLLTVLAM